MIRYLVIPVFALLAVLIQETVLFSMTFDTLRVNVAILASVYGGFFLEEKEGLWLSFSLGVFLDGLLSVIPGVCVFSYVSINYLARWMSGRMSPGKMWPLALFTFLVSFVEFFFFYALSGLFSGKDLSDAFLLIYLPQATVAAVMYPVVFTLFHRIAGMKHGERENTAYQV